MKRSYLNKFCFIMLLTGCKSKIECKYDNLVIIMAERTVNNEHILYNHYIVANGLSKDCLDSSKTVEMLRLYISSCVDDLPIYKISLFNKVEDFDSGETLSQPKSFFKNQILDVYFDTAMIAPSEFVFYDNSGNEVYRSNKWMKK